MLCQVFVYSMFGRRYLRINVEVVVVGMFENRARKLDRVLFEFYSRRSKLRRWLAVTSGEDELIFSYHQPHASLPLANN